MAIKRMLLKRFGVRWSVKEYTLLISLMLFVTLGWPIKWLI